MLDGLMSQLGKSDALGKVAANLGVDEATAKKGVGDTMSSLFDSVKQMTATEDGRAKLQAAVDGADESVLDDPSSVLSGGGNGQQVLDDVFGGGNDIAQKAAGSSGLPVGQIMKLLPVLLPILLGFLKKFMGGKGMDMNGLAGMLSDSGGSTEGGGFLAKLKSLFK
jgi:hypothetical protein